MRKRCLLFVAAVATACLCFSAAQVRAQFPIIEEEACYVGSDTNSCLPGYYYESFSLNLDPVVAFGWLWFDTNQTPMGDVDLYQIYIADYSNKLTVECESEMWPLSRFYIVQQTTPGGWGCDNLPQPWESMTGSKVPTMPSYPMSTEVTNLVPGYYYVAVEAYIAIPNAYCDSLYVLTFTREPCDVVCPEGAATEQEGCIPGMDVNGCGLGHIFFESLQCGSEPSVVCGKIWWDTAQTNFSDQDIYEITTTAYETRILVDFTSEVSPTSQAQFLQQYNPGDPDDLGCANLIVPFQPMSPTITPRGSWTPVVTPSACVTSTLDVTVPAGTYYLNIYTPYANGTVDCVSLGGDYTLRMTCETFNRPFNTCWGCVGDMTRDGLLNGEDIQLFVDCLLNPECADGCTDVNNDGVIDFGDIQPFVDLLTSNATCPPIPDNGKCNDHEEIVGPYLVTVLGATSGIRGTQTGSRGFQP